ncbi:carboxypeptidase-like regulatory domain-containing protein [Owenweeksia hongkongensis]|uniref:carboxypeptidase-like regulatory domain-containing protein n=1 Tax=Owenweeksia hongkongensis TaxID=253245 RepID=UPI003A9527C7
MEKKVNINFTCPISWESMKSINDKERFCNKCSKKVSDFSKDKTIDTANPECGMFRTDQVNIVTRTFNLGKREILTLSLISFLGLGPIATKAQVNSQDSIKTSQSDTLKPFRFTGTVKDKGSSEALAYANIILKYESGQIITGASTDIDGKFSIEMDASINLNEVMVEITSIGYTSLKLALKEADFNETTLQFDLNLFELDETIMGDFIIIVDSPKDPTLYHSKTFDSEDIKGAYRR